MFLFPCAVPGTIPISRNSSRPFSFSRDFHGKMGKRELPLRMQISTLLQSCSCTISAVGWTKNWTVFDGEPTIVMPSPKNAFGLAVTLTFDLFTSKSTQFIFVPNSTDVVNLQKFPQAVYKDIVLKQTFSVRSRTVRTHARTYARTSRKRNTFGGSEPVQSFVCLPISSTCISIKRWLIFCIFCTFNWFSHFINRFS